MTVPGQVLPLFVVIGDDSPLKPQTARGGDVLLVQYARYAANAATLCPQFKYVLHYTGYFGVRYQMVLVCGVFQIAIGGIAAGVLAKLTLGCQCGADLSGDILGVYLIYQIFQ